MDLTRKDIEKLAEKKLAGNITPEELSVLNSWVDKQVAKDSYVVNESFAADENELRDRMLNVILSEINSDNKGKYIKLKSPYSIKTAIAVASILIVIGVAFFVFELKREDTRKYYARTSEYLNPDSINSGNNNALLVLESGDTISLSLQQQGIIVKTNGVAYENGEELLNSTNGDSNDPNQLLTLSTPTGTTYKVTLPDKSVVWLNANSKISYPRVFSKDSREVKFVGEGFFDVVKDNKRPFKIITENQEIQVLGTRFNVYDYKPSKESITTLVDGLIKMRSNNSDRFSYVRANEQAVINENTIEVHKVDVRPYIAWMEGFFYFDEASPKNALDQLAHWYDLEIIYADDIPQIKFYGMINRKKSLGSILRILEKSGMKFKVDKVNEQKRLLVF